MGSLENRVRLELQNMETDSSCPATDPPYGGHSSHHRTTRRRGRLPVVGSYILHIYCCVLLCLDKVVKLELTSLQGVLVTYLKHQNNQ